MEFYVKDYSFFYDISPLFEKKIVIYGAGYQGEITLRLLDKIGVKVESFCDGDENKRQYLGYQVITVDELKTRTDKAQYLVIVGSINYCDEIVEILKEKKIDAYVCSWYGIQKGIEINIEDNRLPEAFRNDWISRKKMWLRVWDERGCKIETWHYQLYLCTHPDSVFIYQPSKVGSTTLWKTLGNEKIDVIHIHFLCHTYITGNGKLEFRDQPDAGWVDIISEIRKRKKTLKMVVCVREPVGRSLSSFMQSFGIDFSPVYDMNLGFKENAYNFIERQLTEDYEFTWWFDEELKAVTGIDIYKYPFDKEKGYTWIKEDGIEILLLKMEQMNENQDVIGDFVGKPQLKLARGNVGDEKSYRYIYRKLKNDIMFPIEKLNEWYGNERFRHFYSEEEIKRFTEQWRQKDE